MLLLCLGLMTQPSNEKQGRLGIVFAIVLLCSHAWLFVTPPKHPRPLRLHIPMQQTAQTITFQLDSVPCCKGPRYDVKIPQKRRPGRSTTAMALLLRFYRPLCGCADKLGGGQAHAHGSFLYALMQVPAPTSLKLASAAALRIHPGSKLRAASSSGAARSNSSDCRQGVQSGVMRVELSAGWGEVRCRQVGQAGWGYVQGEVR